LLNAEIKSAPGINVLLLMEVHTDAALFDIAHPLPSNPHAGTGGLTVVSPRTVVLYTARFEMALMSTEYAEPTGST